MHSAQRRENLRHMIDQVAPPGQLEGLRESLESRTAPADESPSLDTRRVSPAGLEAEMALESLDLLRQGNEIDAEQQFALEAIVMPYHRPVVDVVDDYLQTNQLTTEWRKLAAETLRPWIKERVRSIGRINVPNLPSLPYAGTGFIVGDGLLMTNRHVASIFAQGLGTRMVQFQPGQTSEIDFYHENGRPTSESLVVEKVVMIHPWWDMAILKVNGLPADRKPLQLNTADPESLRDREVVVVGYPGYDPDPDEEFQRIQNRIFRGNYYVKRLQPGLLRARANVDSYRRPVSAITHDCSTLGGNSGSAVIDLITGQIVGLHFAGAYLLANYAVSMHDLAQDSRVVDAGLNFVGRLDPRGDFYGPLWREADATEGLATMSGASTTPISPSPSSPAPAISTVTAIQLPDAKSSANWTIPLHVSVSVGTPVLSASAPATTSASQVAPDEGLFGRRVPTSKSEFVDRFAAASLVATKFEWPTALSMALASRLAYDTAAEVESTAFQAWRMQTVEFIEADDTQCFVASCQDATVVAFRGTENLGDWLGNLNLLSTSRSYGKVHRGFLGAFQVVDAKLRSVLSRFPGKPLLLTGHSLGGALATVAAAEWKGQIPISWIYTFGQPAVGKGGFAAFFQQQLGGHMFRFVNDDDIVPRVPPTYDHVGALYHFDSSHALTPNREALAPALTKLGNAVTSQTPPMLNELEFDRLRAQLLEQRVRRRLGGTESLSPAVVEGLLPSVADHSLDRYLAKIAAQVN